MFKSKTREGAKVVSRLASFSEYKVGNNIDIGNKAPIGSLTFEQMILGVDYDNTQDAIDDLISTRYSDIGEIICNSTGISPQPVQQSTRATFSGGIILESKDDGSPGDPVIIHILGIPLLVSDGDDYAAVARRWYDKIQELADEGKIVNSASQSAITPSIVDFMHLDYKDHEFEPFIGYGLRVEFQITSPAKYGIGLWDGMGSETKTLGTTEHTLHYFKRIG